MDDKVRLIDANKLKKRLIEGDGHDDDRFTEGYNFAINECRKYIDEAPTVEAQPVKRDKMLRDTVSELCEAKRLLKAAVEDIHELLCDKKNLGGNGQSCNICSYIDWCSCCEECTIREDLRNWRHADAAIELIGEDGESE